jgi:hypothetical protein
VRIIALLFPIVCVACKGPNNDTGWTADPDFAISAEILCPSPTEGNQRFSEQSAKRGLLAPLETVDLGDIGHAPGIGGDLVASDFDGDGDIDILAGGLYGEPLFFENDAHGYFQQVLPSPIAISLQPMHTIMTWGAGDLNGDLLPEIIYGGADQFGVYINQGDWSFKAGQKTNFGVSEEPNHSITFALGDADQDGDLDLFIPTDGPTSEGGASDPTIGSPDVLFLLNSDREFVKSLEFVVGEQGSRSQAAAFTDRDQDGDMDLLNLSDLGPPSSFFRNDGVDSTGLPQFIDDAEAIHANLQMSAMGIDSADINHDVWLDYCASDVGLPKCLLSDGTGGYYEGHAALGITLSPENQGATHHGTIGWSIDLADLDNDGRVDLVQSSGPDPGAYSNSELDIPDMIWMRQKDGSYKDSNTEMGFDSPANHIGMVSADFNGDGYLDIAVSGPGKTIDLHMNECGSNGWLEVELIGPSGNAEGLGAQVHAQWGTHQETREIHGLRSHGQGPSRAHFGFGSAEQVDLLEVRWPDGHISTALNLPVRRQIVVRHPDAVDGKFQSNVEAKPFVDDGSAPNGMVRVSGEVIEYFGNQPLEGALVWDEAAPQTTASTDSEGLFSIDLPKDQPTKLVASHEESLPTILSVHTAYQISVSEGISLALLTPDQLELIYFYIFSGESEPGYTTLIVSLRDMSGGDAYGAKVELSTTYEALMSVNLGMGTHTDTLQEGDNAMIFFNVLPSETDVEFLALTAEGEPCEGPDFAALRADHITMLQFYCP